MKEDTSSFALKGGRRGRGHKWSLVLIRNRKIASKRFISKRTQFFEMVLIRKEEREGGGCR